MNMNKKDHQIVATWIFGTLTFVFLVAVFIFAPNELPPYKHRLLSLFSSALAGFFTFFLSGTIGISGTPKLPFVGQLGLRASGGAAVFALVLFWWSTDFAPVKVEEKSTVVPFIEAADLHLGDNVYPNRWGYSHNPLYIAIHPQPSKGLIYLDKDTGEFLAGTDNQTHIGQWFVNYYRQFVQGCDFSGYKFVSAYEGGTNMPSTLKQYIESRKEDRIVRLGGPTILFTNKDNRGDFYDRYAAVGVVRAIDFTIPLAREGRTFAEAKLKRVEFIVECYHGGIRPKQSHNFALLLNGNVHEIRTLSANMREKEVVQLTIPLTHLNYSQENIAAIFVLPWQEERPKSFGTEKGPVHFRDVGIVNAYFKVVEK